MVRLADPDLAERRRRQILDAALVCFRRRGFHQATMQEICSEAGISPGALYRYFGSKSDIIAAIAEDRQSQDLFEAELAANETVVDYMCAGARRFMEKMLLDENGLLLADVFAEVARDPLLAKSLTKLDQNRVHAFANHIRDAQKRAEIDPNLDPELAADTLCAALEGIVLRYTLRRRTDVEGALAQFRALAERYLASEAAA